MVGRTRKGTIGLADQLDKHADELEKLLHPDDDKPVKFFQKQRVELEAICHDITDIKMGKVAMPLHGFLKSSQEDLDGIRKGEAGQDTSVLTKISDATNVEEVNRWQKSDAEFTAQYASAPLVADFIKLQKNRLQIIDCGTRIQRSLESEQKNPTQNLSKTDVKTLITALREEAKCVRYIDNSKNLMSVSEFQSATNLKGHFRPDDLKVIDKHLRALSPAKPRSGLASFWKKPAVLSPEERMAHLKLLKKDLDAWLPSGNQTKNRILSSSKQVNKLRGQVEYAIIKYDAAHPEAKVGQKKGEGPALGRRQSTF